MSHTESDQWVQNEHRPNHIKIDENCVNISVMQPIENTQISNNNGYNYLFLTKNYQKCHINYFEIIPKLVGIGNTKSIQNNKKPIFFCFRISQFRTFISKMYAYSQLSQ